MRTTSEGSISSLDLLAGGAPGGEDFCELAGRTGSAIGAGVRFGFALGSLSRPDCAVAPGVNTAANTRTKEMKPAARTDGSRFESGTGLTARRARLRPDLLFLEANRPTLSEPVLLETDDGHVSYESGGDHVQRAARAARK